MLPHVWHSAGDMNARNTKVQIKGSTTLYDIGLAPLFWFLIAGASIVLGIVIDFLWNWLILTAALWMLKGGGTLAASTVPDIRRRHELLYCAWITIIGLFFNWIYFALAWSDEWTPRINLPVQVLLMVPAIGLLWLANFILSRYVLKLDKRQASTVAIIMAVFTAPWLMLILPYAM